MESRTGRVFLVLSCMMFMAGGCAKHEMVKTDQGVAPAASASEKAPVKTEVVQELPVNQAKVAESTIGENQKNEELKSALAKIFFNFDSYKLSDESRSELVKNATMIKKDSAEKVRIEGNCDERGSDEYNLALGEKRAKAAMEYLVTLGIPAERLTVISYGKEKPADPGHDEAAWAKNRRDEFVVLSR
jgi:peptidoglycan-associated lipoprotein